MLVANQQLIDLGTVKVSHPYRFNFIVKNTSEKVVRIERLAVSCGGCTEASMDKQSLAPQEESNVSVIFTPNSTGIQTKSVIVNYEGHQLKLRFTANVHG